MNVETEHFKGHWPKDMELAVEAMPPILHSFYPKEFLNVSREMKFHSDGSFLANGDLPAARTRAVLTLFDGRGKQPKTMTFRKNNVGECIEKSQPHLAWNVMGPQASGRRCTSDGVRIQHGLNNALGVVSIIFDFKVGVTVDILKDIMSPILSEHSPCQESVHAKELTNSDTLTLKVVLRIFGNAYLIFWSLLQRRMEEKTGLDK